MVGAMGSIRSGTRRRGVAAKARGRAVLAALVTVSTLLAGPHPSTLGGRLALAAPPSAPSASAVPPPADAATDVASAEKLYANLDYDHANLVSARVLNLKGLTHDQLVRALRVLALTDASLGHEDQAREELIELLTYQADFQVDPNLGPRVTAPFLEARGFWRARPEKPGIEVLATVHVDGPGTLRVVTRDPTHIVKSGTIGFRWGTSVPYTTTPLTVSGGGDGFVIDIPERPANMTRLDYYALAFDEREDAVFEVGNAASPKSVVVDIPKVVVVPPPKKSILASPIFWTVAGVVVAGAAVTTVLLTRPRSPTGATLTGGAECGSGSSAMPCH